MAVQQATACLENSSKEPSRFVSIVVPCLNEEKVVGEFVDWCFEGLKKANIPGEVLIVDSSTDRSPQIAAEHGARVLQVPKCGLGQAYLDAIPHIRGNYVIMGDADLTYDFRELRGYIEKLDQGYEFVMGTRLGGSIEPGAMPKLHRYFGTPLTTFILNFMYGSHFSDIHCGMRAMTLDALKRINLQSTSWEYASEMVLKSSCVGLRTTEIPIKFYKDREGRESHHKRSGWFSPWQAGWINLKVMFLHAPAFFLFWPSLLLFIVGLISSIGLLGGPRSLFGVGISLHWMLLGVTMAALGHSGLQLCWLSEAYYGFNPVRREKILHYLSYERGTISGGLLILSGVAINFALVYSWFKAGLQLSALSYTSVFGLLLVILGFQLFTHTLILHMVIGGRKQLGS